MTYDVTTLQGLYKEMVNIINEIYGCEHYFTNISKYALVYNQVQLEKEIENISNIIKSIKKLSVISNKIPFYYYLEPDVINGCMHVVLDVYASSNGSLDKEIVEISIPSNWKNLDFDFKFKTQIHTRQINYSKILSLKIKSLEQLIIPLNEIKELIDNNVLILYVNGKLVEEV